MKSLEPLGLIRAGRWRRATLTTYSLSASFAEAVVIEALLRQGAYDISLLVDPVGIRMALREQGAVRIGREYYIHGVAVEKGCFHPKLMILEPEDEGPIHTLVGSWNLTFGGWSANLECVDHLDTERSPTAMAGIADFFSKLSDSKRCKHEARKLCADLSDRIMGRLRGQTEADRILVVHSLAGNIADAVVAAAQGLGGATSLTCVSPYWDGEAIDQLAHELRLKTYSAHVPKRAMMAPGALSWPRGSKMVRPVTVSALANDEHGGRDLHAKLLEVLCKKGRVVLGGSANATGAALYTASGAGNIEVCTLRAEPSTKRAWKTIPAKAPSFTTSADAEDGTEEEFGILVAEHTEDGVEGRILTPWNSNSAVATLLVGRKAAELGIISIGKDHRFTIPLETLADDDLSLEGRVQLRLCGNNKVAEGFISAPDFKTLKRRAGTTLPAMLAVLKQMQTPEDVLAIFEFFRSNPGAFKVGHAFTGRSPGSSGMAHDPIVIARLVGTGAGGGGPKDNEGRDAEETRSELIWQRLFARLLASMAKAKPPSEDAEDEEDNFESKRRRRSSAALDKLGLRFPGAFQEWSKQVEDDVSYLSLFRLTQFVCVTTKHESAAAFISRLVEIAIARAFGLAARESAGWGAVILAGRTGDSMEISLARSRLLGLSLDPEKLDPESAPIGLLEVIAPDRDIQSLLAEIRSCSTVYEEIRLLEAGLASDTLPTSLPILESHAGWSRLKAQFGRESQRRRLQFVDHPVPACQICRIKLIDHLLGELKRYGVTETDCHGFILARNP